MLRRTIDADTKLGTIAVMDTGITFILISLAFLACGDGSSQPADGSVADGGGFVADASSDFSTANGTLTVGTNLSQNIVSLSGSFGDGPIPEFMTETQRIGNCRLMGYTPSLCTPACQNADLCLNGSCQSFPSPEDRGSIDWSWPGGQATIVPTSSFYEGSGQLSMHGEVTVTVQGNTLRVPTHARPEAMSDWGAALTGRSGDVVLRWSNAVASARVKLTMTDCAGSHGGIAEVEIRCESPDTGALTLPSSFLDALDGADWSRGECGSHSLVRYHSDSPDGGDFRLEARAESSFYYRPEL